MDSEHISLEVGWRQIQKGGLDVLEEFMEQQDLSAKRNKFPLDVFVRNYTLVHSMSSQPLPDYWGNELYERHKLYIKGYLSSKVLPMLEDKLDEDLMEQLVFQWARHKIMKRKLEGMFSSLDRHVANDLDNLKTVGCIAFKTEIFDPIKDRIVDAVQEQLRRERDVEMVNRNLLDKTLGVFEAMLKVVLNHPRAGSSSKASLNLRKEARSNVAIVEMLQRQQIIFTAKLIEGKVKYDDVFKFIFDEQPHLIWELIVFEGARCCEKMVENLSAVPLEVTEQPCAMLTNPDLQQLFYF